MVITIGAGGLADRVVRRLYIVCCQLWMMLASIMLTVLAEADHHRHLVDAAARQRLELPVDQRLAADRQQAFGTVVGVRRQARSLSGAEQDGFHQCAGPFAVQPQPEDPPPLRAGLC